MQRRVADWMVHLADPQGPRTRRPSRRLDEAATSALFVLAEQHGVLPSIVMNSEFLDNDSGTDRDSRRPRRSVITAPSVQPYAAARERLSWLE